MKEQQVEELKTILDEVSNTVGERFSVKLELDKFKRIVEKLNSFSPECEECAQYLNNLENHILGLKHKVDQLTKHDITRHKQKISAFSSHLQKQHKIVPNGYYLSLYMSFGISLGLIFGMLLFDNIALGLPIGTGVGMAIGSGLDADAKKKGMTL